MFAFVSNMSNALFDAKFSFTCGRYMFLGKELIIMRVLRHFEEMIFTLFLESLGDVVQLANNGLLAHGIRDPYVIVLMYY